MLILSVVALVILAALLLSAGILLILVALVPVALVWSGLQGAVLLVLRRGRDLITLRGPEREVASAPLLQFADRGRDNR